MSLQVWLPLNGNINNYGIANPTILNLNATIDNNGKIGQCYNFAGSGQRIKINPNPIQNSITSFSICAWIYPTALNTALFGARTSGSGSGLLGILSTSSFYFDDGVRFTCSRDNNDLLNSWHHIAFIKNPTQKLIYIDGILVGSENSTAATADIKNELTIGNDSYEKYSDNDFLGKINDVRIYNHALSEQEIKEIAKGLIVHYPLTGAPNSNLYQKPVRLPVEYQEVEYIESTGTQYIDTGYKPNSNTIFNIKYRQTGAITDNMCPYGVTSAASGNTANFGMYRIFGAANRICFGGNSNNNTLININNYDTINIDYTIFQNKNKVYINNNLITTFNTESWDAQYNLFLFSRNNANSSTFPFKGRIYYCNIIEDNICIQKLIPAKRISDNVLGMYDIISRTFLTNAGSGEFILGPVASIPDDYIAVDYLNMKRGSYIDTGISVANTHQFNFKYSVQSVVQWYGPFQAYTDEASVTTRIIANSTSTTNVFVYFMSRAGSGGAPAVSNMYSGNGDIIEGYMNYNKTYIYNHTTKKTFDIINAHNAGNASTAHMMISASAASAARSRIYYFDTYNNGTLIQALRPVIRVSDRKPGMYDLVTGTFFINQGTDEEFTYAINGIEYDISGFKNEKNTSINLATILTSTNSVRYPKSYIGNSSHPWIKNNNFTYQGTTWTASIWYYLASNPANQTFFAIGNGNGGLATRKAAVVTSTTSPLKLSIVIEGGTNPTVETTLNQWHNITLTSDGTTGSYYYDGELKGTIAVSKNIIPTNLGIGIKNTADNFSTSEWPFASGQLSDFRFYASCFNATQVAELYNMGRLS